MLANNLQHLHKQLSYLDDTPVMPVLFVGHGTPLNAIEDNEFAQKWIEIGQKLPQPQAILCVSAHWETRGTYVTAMQTPKTIHDFYGFPRELYMQQYQAPGFPELANDIKENVQNFKIDTDYEWGLDHGTWSILKYFYPKADIPVLQLSIDFTKDMQYHYDLAQQLSYLRQKGVLIIGSGNMIHNLGMLQVQNNDFNAQHGYEWAIELNTLFKEKIEQGDHKPLIHYNSLSKWTKLAMPTLDHYIPMVYALALQQKEEEVDFFNDKIIAGALSMTSLIIH